MAETTEGDESDQRYEGGRPLRQTGGAGWFPEYLSAGLEQAGISPAKLEDALTDRSALYRGGRQSKGAGSQQAIRDIIKRKYGPSVSTAWGIGQALRTSGTGARWSSGPLALAAAGYYEHLLGFLGSFLQLYLEHDDLYIIFSGWKLIKNAPYVEQLLAILHPDEYENRLVPRLAPDEELQAARHRLNSAANPTSSIGAYLSTLNAAVSVAARERLQFIEKNIVVEEELLPSLDAAWLTWTKIRNPSGELPASIVDLIKIASLESIAPMRRREIWDAYGRFIITLESWYPKKIADFMDKRRR